VIFHRRPVVDPGRLDFVTETPKMYPLPLERYQGLPLAVLLSPVNSFVFRLRCPRTLFSVVQILGIARGSEVATSIVHPIVVDMVDHHAVADFDDLPVYVY